MEAIEDAENCTPLSFRKPSFASSAAIACVIEPFAGSAGYSAKETGQPADAGPTLRSAGTRKIQSPGVGIHQVSAVGKPQCIRAKNARASAMSVADELKALICSLVASGTSIDVKI